MVESMKTEELVKELRERCTAMVSPTGRAHEGITAAADRLEAILKAWRMLDGASSGNAPAARQALRRAITGDSH